MFFCVEGHIIIFKEEIGEVVVDAATCEFDNGFLLCPEAGEGDLGIGRGLDKGKFLGRKDVTGEGFTITSYALDINADGVWRENTGYSGFAMRKIKV